MSSSNPRQNIRVGIFTYLKKPYRIGPRLVDFQAEQCSFVHLFKWSSVHLFICSSGAVFICSFVHLFVRSSGAVFICSFVHLFICSFVRSSHRQFWPKYLIDFLTSVRGEIVRMRERERREERKLRPTIFSFPNVLHMDE